MLFFPPSGPADDLIDGVGNTVVMATLDWARLDGDMIQNTIRILKAATRKKNNTL